MIFWVGASVSPQVLLDLFGVDDFLALDANNMVSSVSSTKNKYSQFYLCRRSFLFWTTCCHGKFSISSVTATASVDAFQRRW